MTYFFCVSSTCTFVHNLGQLLSISCSKLLEHSGFTPQIKWPNDVLVENKKIAGILCEIVPLEEKFAVVLGIGLNINMDSDTVSAIDQPATSLQLLSGQEWSLDETLYKLSKYFLEDLSTLQKKGFTPFHSYYEKHLAFKGQLVTVQDGNRIIQGLCHELSPQGHLIIVSSSGEHVEVHAGSLSPC
jgi:BirA family biotin operon repressor/biotin-[acetyl-CoA-carboxylase] ligase